MNNKTIILIPGARLYIPTDYRGLHGQIRLIRFCLAKQDNTLGLLIEIYDKDAPEAAPEFEDFLQLDIPSNPFMLYRTLCFLDHLTVFRKRDLYDVYNYVKCRGNTKVEYDFLTSISPAHVYNIFNEQVQSKIFSIFSDFSLHLTKSQAFKMIREEMRYVPSKLGNSISDSIFPNKFLTFFPGSPVEKILSIPPKMDMFLMRFSAVSLYLVKIGIKVDILSNDDPGKVLSYKFFEFEEPVNLLSLAMAVRILENLFFFEEEDVLDCYRIVDTPDPMDILDCFERILPKIDQRDLAKAMSLKFSNKFIRLANKLWTGVGEISV